MPDPMRDQPVTTPRHPRTAVIWCNVGTPDAPTPSAVRRYLAQFLSDPRIVEMPRLLWRPILHGWVLRTRPARSAARYAAIWTSEGSPLKIWTEKQAKLLQGWLGHNGYRVTVVHAMRYGEPSVATAIEHLRKQGISRILILPAYPQYSSTTTASLIDSVSGWSQQARHIPEWRFVNNYHKHPLYIHALAKHIKKHWQHQGRSKILLMSFHGAPQRTHQLGDPYADQCRATAQLLAQALELPKEHYQVTFQSRFGRDKWLQPYTAVTLEQLARKGIDRVDVICPGFVADCLETLEEIAIEGRQTFLAAGGKAFHYIPCLNDDPEWVTALGTIAARHLAGWLDTAPLPR